MLRAYTEGICAARGESLPVMVSTDAASYTAEVVRLLHGDPNPAGPGPQEERTNWLTAQEYPGSVQPLQVGSWLSLPVNEPLRSFTFACWICPTAHTARQQVIATWAGQAGESLRLWITDDWCIAAAIASESSGLETVTAEAEIRPWRWHFVGCSFDCERRLLGVFSAARGASVFAAKRIQTKARALRPADGPLYLGAVYQDGGPRNRYNGKIGASTLLADVLDDVQLSDLKGGHPPASVRLMGCWDLSREVHSRRIVDVSGQDNHGIVHNGAARGVTGHRWGGPDDRAYAAAPTEYDAVHLHDDDLEDANWQPSFSVQIPADARSSIYGMRLTSASETTTLCFVVRGDPSNPAPVLFIVPTLTWLAYANWEDNDRARIGLSLYNNHSDGTANYYATLRKPTASFRPSLYFNTDEAGAAPKLDPTSTAMEEPATHLIMADLYMIHWLEQLGIAYEVASDHEFHAAGLERLRRHRVVISAGHHEYWTAQMLDAMDGYLVDGGRLMYMSGNGLYWATSIHPEHPHLMEVRRSGGTATGEALPGELQHSYTGTSGGLWRDQGRAPQRLVGVGMAGQGFSRAPGFRRLPDSFDPRVAFIFEGVGADEVIGDFGLNLGGACGFEFDRADHALGTPHHALLLASSFNPPPTYYRAIENGVGRGPDDPLVRGDMVYFERPSGGAVFAVGSVTWTGSLSHNGYCNNVARISENVLHHFLNQRA